MSLQLPDTFVPRDDYKPSGSSGSSGSGSNQSSQQDFHVVKPFPMPDGDMPEMSQLTFLKFFEQWNQIAGDDRDAQLSGLSAFMQYFLSELNYRRDYNYAEMNYQRSTAANQAALMQSAGMSRAAALAALQGGSTTQSVQSQDSLNPNPTTIEQNQVQRTEALIDIIQSAADLSNKFAAFAQTPFDFKSKEVTAQLLQYQSDMLGSQIQGMQDAAMFLQAVANADASNEPGAKLVDLSVNDQFAYFADMAGKQYDASKHKASAWQYSQSESFRRAAGNPFFWSTLNNEIRNRNEASASAFFPEMAERQNASLRAAVQLTQQQAANEKVRGRILNVQAFRDETLKLAETQLQQFKIECETAGLKFDKARADAFLQRVKDFNELDFLNLDYQIARIAGMKNAELYEKEIRSLSESYDYQAAQFYYLASLYSLKHGVLQQMYDYGNDGVSIYGNDELNQWIKSSLQFNELGNITEKSYILDKIKVGVNGLIGGAATIFGGAQLVKGLTAARAANAGYSFSSTAAGITGSTTASPLGIPLLFLGLQGDTNSTYTRIMRETQQGDIGLPMN